MTEIRTDDFIVKVVRSKRRRTLSLAVKDAAVTVRMPEKLPLHHAKTFISQKAHWIKQKLASQTPPPERTFSSGEQLPFLGRSLSLLVSPAAAQNHVCEDNGHLRVSCKAATPSTDALSRHITRWFRQQAEAYLATRFEELVRLTGLKPLSLTVKSYRARWGSCHISGAIQLNWKLIMAPPAVIDYVIIHELCHLKQHNHSRAFWQLVENFDPHFTVHRAWLRANGGQLEL